MRIGQFNVLFSDFTYRMKTRCGIPYSDADNDSRIKLIVEEIVGGMLDIVCMQEVDRIMMKELLKLEKYKLLTDGDHKEDFEGFTNALLVSRDLEILEHGCIQLPDSRNCIWVDIGDWVVFTTHLPIAGGGEVRLSCMKELILPVMREKKAQGKKVALLMDSNMFGDDPLTAPTKKMICDDDWILTEPATSTFFGWPYDKFPGYREDAAPLDLCVSSVAPVELTSRFIPFTNFKVSASDHAMLIAVFA